MGPAFNMFLERSILPPGIVLLVLAWAGWRAWRVSRTVAMMIWLAFVMLYAANISATGEFLFRTLESHPPLTPAMLAETKAQAIVILGHSRYPKAPEYGGVDTLNPGGLVRARYGAWLQRATGLPILTAGGRMYGEKKAESELMKEVLVKEFGVPVRWTEEQSRNTYENARFSAEMLAKEGIERVLLVTHHRDMPRALWAFDRVGLEAIPAPTIFRAPSSLNWMDWLPEAGNAYGIRVVLHEWIGKIWYALRY